MHSTRTAPVTLPGCTYKTGRGLVSRVIFHRIRINDKRSISTMIAISRCIPRRLRVFIVFDLNDRRILSSTRTSTETICSFSRSYTTVRHTTVTALGFRKKKILFFLVALLYTLIDSGLCLSVFSVWSLRRLVPVFPPVFAQGLLLLSTSIPFIDPRITCPALFNILLL